MTTFIISGSIDDSSGATPTRGSYQTCVYGSLSVDDSRCPLAAIYNPGTGSLTLRKVRASVGPAGTQPRNDVTFLLGSVASGSISGSSVTPTPLTSTYPAAVGVCYKTPSQLATSPSMNGTLAQAQSFNVQTAPSAVAVLNMVELEENDVVLGPNYGYIVCLAENTVLSSNTTWAYTVEFTHDE